jgi:SAM-dependent methyltransferase
MQIESSYPVSTDERLLRTLEALSAEDELNDWILSQIEPYIGERILEVGCGVGAFTRRFVKYGEVVAIDPWPEAVSRARLLVGDKARVELGGVEDLRLPDQDFDTVVCLNVLEHIPNDLNALQEMRTRLKTGGFLLLLTPAHPWLFGTLDRAFGHQRRYRRKQLEVALSSAAFEIRDLRRFNFLGVPGWFLAGRILRRKQIGPSLFGTYRRILPFGRWVEDRYRPPLGLSLIAIAEAI